MWIPLIVNMNPSKMSWTSHLIEGMIENLLALLTLLIIFINYIINYMLNLTVESISVKVQFEPHITKG